MGEPFGGCKFEKQELKECTFKGGKSCYNKNGNFGARASTAGRVLALHTLRPGSNPWHLLWFPQAHQE